MASRFFVRQKPGMASRNFLNEQEPKENLRDFEAEYGLRSVLEQYFPAWNSYGELYFSNEDDACLYRLLTEGLAHIGQMAELYLSDRMKRIQVQPQPNLQIGVRINGGLLDMDIDAERLPKQELQGLLNSYRQRRKILPYEKWRFFAIRRRLSDNTG